VVAAVQKLSEKAGKALFKVSDKLWPEVHAMWSKEPEALPPSESLVWRAFMPTPARPSSSWIVKV
jgi:hypothetical protein